MHAFLIITNNPENAERKVKEIVKKLKAKKLNFPLAKINDVRDLNAFVKLSINAPTAIVCNNIYLATEEAQNAFLKNLEEPQKNLYYILIAPTLKKILPTVVSRCQIIKLIDTEHSTVNSKKIENFLQMSTGEKLNFAGNIRDRETAKEFVKDLISFWHKDINKNFQNIEIALITLRRLNANGNTNLQLTNLIISLV